VEDLMRNFRVSRITQAAALAASSLLFSAIAAYPNAALAQAAAAQTTAQIPDAPTPQTAKPGPEAPVPIAGDSFYAPIATGKGPESLKTKTESYIVVTFGPRALVAPAFSAAFRMARPPAGYPREWRDGGAAFGRNYGAALGGKVALETGRYAAGALLHEDFRYVPSTEKGSARLFHAIGYTFVDRSDSGHPRLAIANFAGAAAGGFVGNLYLPDGYNSPRDGAKAFARRFGGFAINNVTREFAPEIFQAVHALHIPFPRIPVREWWTNGLSVSHP
jgi:hypothetical protein